MTKTVLITGCSTGLGKTTAERFASEGWNVVATMRRPESELVEKYPGTVLVETLDVTDPASVARAVATGEERFGGIDAVVNNAGFTMVSIFETTPMAAIRRMFETNVFGTMNVIQAAIPALRRRGGGTIVNVTSGVGIAAQPVLSIYVSSKQAVEGLSESLSYELESQNIRVRVIEPGAMRTTSFSASGFAASKEAPLPQSYKAWFDHALGTMMDYPFADTPEADVTDAIFIAMADQTDRLRYVVGPDVEEYARLRWTTSEDEYRAGMARLTGQTAWREMAG